MDNTMDNKKRYKAAIFDMDGTILDTIDDLKDALNYALAHFGHRADYTAKETYYFFGSGIRVAAARALATELGEPLETVLSIGTPQDHSQVDLNDGSITEIIDYYKPYYASHCAIKTGPFPGIPELLQKLARSHIKTAVVSNKVDPAVKDLCNDYFPGLFDFSIGEMPDVPRKPAPEMLWRALDALGVTASEAVYLGDTEVDIETASRAGLDCVCFDWGFRTREQLEASGAEHIVSSCEELVQYMGV